MDNRAVMLRYARQLAAAAGADIELLEGSFGSLSESLQLGEHRQSYKLHVASHCVPVV